MPEQNTRTNRDMVVTLTKLLSCEGWSSGGEKNVE